MKKFFDPLSSDSVGKETVINNYNDSYHTHSEENCHPKLIQSQLLMRSPIKRYVSASVKKIDYSFVTDRGNSNAPKPSNYCIIDK